MSEVKHTPGPWIAHALNHAHDQLWLQVSQVLPDGSKRGPICRPASPAEPLRNGALAEIRFMVTPEENQCANARLMAAAPEMLDSLVAIRTWIEEMLEVTDSPGDRQTLQTHLGICERAISRAITPTTAECPIASL